MPQNSALTNFSVNNLVITTNHSETTILADTNHSGSTAEYTIIHYANFDAKSDEQLLTTKNDGKKFPTNPTNGHISQ